MKDNECLQFVVVLFDVYGDFHKIVQLLHLLLLLLDLSHWSQFCQDDYVETWKVIGVQVKAWGTKISQILWSKRIFEVENDYMRLRFYQLIIFYIAIDISVYLW